MGPSSGGTPLGALFFFFLLRFFSRFLTFCLAFYIFIFSHFLFISSFFECFSFCFFHFSFFLRKSLFFSFYLVFLSNIFNRQVVSATSFTVSQYRSRSAPWRCGVLTIIGRDSWDWVGPLMPGGEHASTPREWGGGSSPVKTEPLQID